MKKEKLELGLQEALEEIELALKDKRGLVAYQRRLAFSISLGASILLELYLKSLSIMKEGAKINHLWFKKKKSNVFEQLQNQITKSIENVENIDRIIDLMIKIEEKRDDLAYGAPSKDSILQEKINLFFELKKVTKC